MLQVVLAKESDLKIQLQTRFALHVSYNRIDVDLLPVPLKLLNMDHQTFLQTVDRYSNPDWLSVVGAKHQVKFIRDEINRFGTDRTNRLIQLMKCWVSSQRWSKHNKPKSYAIELLVLRVMNNTEGNEKILELLQKFWNEVLVVRSNEELLDLANTRNNVFDSFEWDEFSQHASSILQEDIRVFGNSLVNELRV
eukprot:c10122_g1_i4.p1 GENE.c10122_g1_i4~~c10122_g1_i4.p1  ORF type:complete len:194 (-),score=45.82 c10122_g1_i4:22-603(-)